ncbi:MAG: S66 peptidase family protein [Spirulinaceae cyanobacterium]
MRTANSELRFPPPLQPGDRLIALAPSGALKAVARLQDGLAVWQRQGYTIELDAGWQDRHSYLGGTDAQRRQALKTAWADPHCKGILCIRGGYGTARLLEDWDWPQTDTPKWLIGFSDITGLSWSLASQGIGSLHGPVLTTLGKEPDWSQQRLFDAVMGRPLAPLRGTGWGKGRANGLLLPGNLAVATHLLNTPVQPNFKNVILAWEDIAEAPYRLDRLITQWRMSGMLEQVAGIALGQFTDCEGDAGTWTVEEMLRDRLSDLNIPIVSNLPFGHEAGNATLPVGKMAMLDGDRGTLTTL